MDKMITATAAPAYGDIRLMSSGQTLWLEPGVALRKDWGRILDAMSAAISRGCDVRWM